MSSNGTVEFPPYTKKYHRSSYAAIDPTNPTSSAAGKVVVVTGGGAGVGKGISKAFVAAGAKAVVILGRRESVLKEAKAELEKAGKSKILAFPADILDKAALDNAFAETEKLVGKIDVLVANAAYLPTQGTLAETDVNEWFKAFEINIKGTVLTFQAFNKHRGNKDPVFIALTTGIVHMDAFPTFSGYSISKLGQAGLVPYLQAENPEVRFYNMHPGVIETEMNAKSGLPLSKDDVNLPSSFAVWLASPAAEWLKGRLLWAHWDVEELTARKQEILDQNELKMGLFGYPKAVEVEVVA